MGVSLNFGEFVWFFWGFLFFIFFPFLLFEGFVWGRRNKTSEIGCCGICPKSGGFGGFSVVFVLVSFEEAPLSDGVVVDSLPTKSVPSEQQLLLFDEALLALLLLLLGFVTISFCKTFHKKKNKKKKKRFKFITLGNLLFFY